MKCLCKVLFLTSCIISATAGASTNINTTASTSAESTMFNNSKLAGVLVEQTTLDPILGLSEAAEQYRIRYNSVSGVDGKSIREDTGAVFIPKGKAPKAGWPVVLWTHGTIGVASKCAPSLNPRSPRDVQYLNTWLSLGFAIVAPDYSGLGSEGLHHYLNSRGEAWSVLDSAEAAISKFPLSNNVVIVGQSQGAHAAFAAAGYQPEYAPNLNIIATVLTGTPYFKPGISAEEVIGGSKPSDKGDPKMPYAMYIYLSAADQDSSLKVEDFFQKSAIEDVKLANKLCIGELTQYVMSKGMNGANSLKPEIQTLLDKELPNMDYNTMKINHPVFVGIGLEDVNVPTKMQQVFANDVLKAGTNATVKEYPGLSHSETVNVSLRDSVPFVLKAMAANDQK